MAIVRIRVCEQCKKEYTTSQVKSKCCSSECRTIKNNSRQSKRRQSNPKIAAKRAKLKSVRFKNKTESLINEFELLDFTDIEHDKEDRKYISVTCSICNERGRTRIGYLREGRRPCGCNRTSPTEAYINLVSDNNTPIAVKIGVATNSANRLTALRSRNTLDINNLSVWVFPTPFDCKKAESDVKENLCLGGILSKADMPDGFTETTYIYNIEAVENTYKNYGGVRID